MRGRFSSAGLVVVIGGGSNLATVMSEPQMSRKAGPSRSDRFWLGVAFYVVFVIGLLGLMIAYIWAAQSDLP
jgi:hypothetical protein